MICRTTHHAGCECHEAKRDVRIADLERQLAERTKERDSARSSHNFAQRALLATSGELSKEIERCTAAEARAVEAEAWTAAFRAVLEVLREVEALRGLVPIAKHFRDDDDDDRVATFEALCKALDAVEEARKKS